MPGMVCVHLKHPQRADFLPARGCLVCHVQHVRVQKPIAGGRGGYQIPRMAAADICHMDT